MDPVRLEETLSYEQLVSLLKARRRRKEDELEWDYTRLRAQVAPLGVDLPKFKRSTRRPKSAPNRKQLETQLAVLERKGIPIETK